MDPTRLRLPGEPNRRSPQHVLAGTDTALGHPRMLRCAPHRRPCDKPLLPGQVSQQQGSDRPHYETLRLVAEQQPMPLLQTSGQTVLATYRGDLRSSSGGPMSDLERRRGAALVMTKPQAARVG